MVLALGLLAGEVRAQGESTAGTPWVVFVRVVQAPSGTEARLANQAFVSKAPPAVLEGARRQLAEQQAKRAELERLLKGLG